MNVASLIPAGILVAACAVAGWGDVFHRRIPNWLCALVAIAGLVIAFAGEGVTALGSHALHMVIALVVGMLLFRIGLFGGGDAKLYAAVASWFSLSKAAMLLLSVALSGVGLLIVWFVFRRIAGKPISRSSNDPYDSLPYGIAIGGGAVIAKLLLI